MMRRMVNQWCSNVVPSLDTVIQVLIMIMIMIAMAMTIDQSSRGSGDFDNYEDEDHDDGDVRLIEQNMTIPSQLDDLQL